MNAPANVRPGRERYIPIVKHHLPACQDAELQLRCSVLLLRDQATSTMRRCSEEAYGVLAQVERLANLNAYAAMPVERLAELRSQLVRLTSCASGLEMFAFKLAYPDGGTGEGG